MTAFRTCWTRRSIAITITVAVAALTALDVPVTAQPANPEAAPTAGPDLGADTRLAGMLARSGRTLLEIRDFSKLSSDIIDAALLLVERAVELDPDDPELWRTYLRIADFAEDEEAAARAIDVLSHLDPADTVIRLRRLNGAIAGYQTVEERLDAYRKLLDDDDNVSRIGVDVASRLALDAALIERRRGNASEFAAWLSRAVSLDSSNAAATAVAAGYFRLNVDDPYAQAELLVSLMLAVPTDVRVQLELADHLLEHGAYEAAARIYAMFQSSILALEQPMMTDVVADRAIALWGAGQADLARDLIEQRQFEHNEAKRRNFENSQPDMDPVEAARQSAAALPITTAVVRAAIYNRESDPLATEVFRAAIWSYQTANNKMIADGSVAPETLARNMLETALVTAWLGTDAKPIRDLVTNVDEKIVPLTDSARQRFDGLVAFREGDLDTAATTLEPLAETDLAARVGLAMVYREQGRQKAAAKHLLVAARAQPGTALGVWCMDLLSEMIGQRLPLSETAVALNQLVDAIPTIVDRYPADGSLALSVRVSPAQTTSSAFEPVMVNIEITNRSPFPLAIGRDAPIKPFLYVLPDIAMAGSLDVLEPAPFVIAIDRRLRLAPRETMVIPVDLRMTPLAINLNGTPLSGATVALRVVVNPRINESRGVRRLRQVPVRPGLLGSEVRSGPVHIEGARTGGPNWAAQAIADLDTIDQPSDLVLAAVIAHAVVDGRTDDPELRRALVDAFQSLPPNARAWLVTVIPFDPQMQAIIDAARQSPDPLVQLAYMTYLTTGPTDPSFDLVRRGGDVRMARIADGIEAFAKFIVSQRGE